MMFRSKSGVPLTEDADMETEADNVPAIQAQ